MTQIPDALPDLPHRPAYVLIAALEHEELFLPHVDERVLAACSDPDCVHERDGATIIELRPGAAAPPAVPGPGTVEEHETPGVPAVPDTVIDGVVVDIDPPLPWHVQIERRPVVAKWIRSAEERRAAAVWAARFAGYRVAFHAVRSPLYGLRTVSYAPRGAGRTVAAAWRWLWDAEGKPLRDAARKTTNTAEYVTLDRIRKERIKTRLLVTAIGASGAAIGWWVGGLFVPHLTLYLLVVAVLAAGVHGRSRDKPIVDNPIISNPAANRLTSGQVVDALGALGMAEINKALGKNGRGIAFANPVQRDGPGWRADVDLPLGITVSAIMERREQLASGLRRPLGAVWPEPAPHIHAGRMVLWVGDQDMNSARQPPYPLMRAGRTTVFEPLPFGTDQRGRPVVLPVMYTNLLIGALPGAGKTFSLRVPLLGAALDPTCELRVFELKGSGDLSPLKKVAHAYASGPGDPETVYAAVCSLREVAAEVRRRAKVISGLPKDLARENKTTPEIAARRSLRLWPLVLAIDECQEVFTDDDYGKEAADLATFIIKTGRAFGVLLWLATQRPDKESLPTGVSANVGTRFCLRVMSHVENDMILGTSAHQSGIKATTFTTEDLGIGYLVGAGPDARIVHTYNVKNDQADRITDRARAQRAAAHTLSGIALGEDVDSEVPAVTDLLDDVAAVIGEEEKMWSERIIARLRELRPGAYDALNTTALANQLREAYGIRTGDTWGVDDEGAQRNRKGVTREQVTRAVEARRANG